MALLVPCFILILLAASISNLCCHAYSCLTWDLQDKTLRMIFRTANFNTSVHFYDNRGERRGFCGFKNQCKNIRFVEKKAEVVLVIKIKRIDKIDGEWLCNQGLDNYTTHVSSSLEMDSSMMLKMKGSIINWNDKMFVEVQCTSCRDPYLNRMEYTLNSNVEDIVSFHSPSRTCFHFSGECAVPLCSCSPMGNEFTRAYEKNGENKMTITCGAMFPVVSTVISRVANLVYDGKEDFRFSEVTDHSKTEYSSHKVQKGQNSVHQGGKELNLIPLPVLVFIVYCFLCMIIKNHLKRKRLDTMEKIPLNQSILFGVDCRLTDRSLSTDILRTERAQGCNLCRKPLKTVSPPILVGLLQKKTDRLTAEEKATKSTSVDEYRIKRPRRNTVILPEEKNTKAILGTGPPVNIRSIANVETKRPQKDILLSKKSGNTLNDKPMIRKSKRKRQENIVQEKVISPPENKRRRLGNEGNTLNDKPMIRKSKRKRQENIVQEKVISPPKIKRRRLGNEAKMPGTTIARPILRKRNEIKSTSADEHGTRRTQTKVGLSNQKSPLDNHDYTVTMPEETTANSNLNIRTQVKNTPANKYGTRQTQTKVGLSNQMSSLDNAENVLVDKTIHSGFMRDWQKSKNTENVLVDKTIHSGFMRDWQKSKNTVKASFKETFRSQSGKENIA